MLASALRAAAAGAPAATHRHPCTPAPGSNSLRPPVTLHARQRRPVPALAAAAQASSFSTDDDDAPAVLQDPSPSFSSSGPSPSTSTNAVPTESVPSDTPHAPGGAAAELSEAEVARRRKISEANSGRVPWNKGRKHSPETIAKIKARTEEAMQRPETKQNFRNAMEKRVQVHTDETKARIGAKVRAYQEQKRIAAGEPEPEEGQGRKKRRSRAKPKPAPPAPGSAEAEAAAAEPPPPKKPRASRAKPPQPLNEDGTPAAPAERKKRAANSEAHKQAIRDAIKAKWADPVYKEYMVQKMKEGAAKRSPDGAVRSPRKKRADASTTTDAPDAPTRSPKAPREPAARKASGSSSGGGGSGSSSSGSLSQSKQQQQVWLLQVQAMVDQLLSSQNLIRLLDQKMDSMRAEEGAFVNDPVMLEKLASLMRQLGDRRQALAQVMAAQQAKIPPNIGFDSSGHVFLKPQPSAPSPAAAHPGNVVRVNTPEGGEALLDLSGKLGDQGSFYRLSPVSGEDPEGGDGRWDAGSSTLQQAVTRSV